VKKILIGLGLAALLSSCLDTGRVSVFDTNFTSEFRDTSNRYVICDNRKTQVTISFTFNEVAPGAFVSWKTILNGNQTGTGYTLEDFGANGTLSLRPTLPPGVTWNTSTNRVSYTIEIFPKTAPLSQKLTAQAIVVVPAPIVDIPAQVTPLGFTKLNLRITDDAGTSVQAFVGDQIRVVDNCPAPAN
jgi:hypothetical protein